MEKRNIGKSGLSAPFLGMGTWAIGGGSWWGDNDDALSVKAILTAVEQGIIRIRSRTYSMCEAFSFRNRGRTTSAG